MPPRKTAPKANPPELYSYQNGKKVLLNKSDSEFVVRTSEPALERMGLPLARRMSPSSLRVAVQPADLETAMTRARSEATTHHLYTRQASGDDFLITDRVLIRFREGVNQDQQSALAGKYGLFRLEGLGGRDYLYQLTPHTDMNPVKLVVAITEQESAVVEFVEHDLNRVLECSALPLPTDPLYLREWHLHQSATDPDFDPRASARCEEAWQLLNHFGSADIVIGVTDDGCRLDHPDFAPSKFAGWGFFQGSDLITDRSAGADPSRMYQSDANHGTSCCGVAAGAANGVFTVGAAPGSRLLPIKWESANRRLLISDSKLLRALDYAADKVDILSNSWGGTPSSVWSLTVVERFRTLALTGGRRGKGILFLFAAGNWNCPLNHSGSTQIPYSSGWSFDAANTPTWVGVRTSAVFANNLVGLDGVMHVAALSSRAVRSHYSCWGEGIALTAPSSNSHTYLRDNVRGLGITTATGLTALTREDFGGTSSATPLVAGIAALVLSANPRLSAVDLASLLRKTASKDLDISAYPKTPPANFDPDTSWDVSPIAPHDNGVFRDRGLADGTWSPWFGHGCVNAFAAVREALRGSSPAPAEAFSSSPDVLIPDNSPAGAVDRIVINAPGTIQNLDVFVEITHTWIGDLRVTLTAPDGEVAVLHDRTGSSGHDIRATYTADTALGLARFRGKPVAGTWKLTATDAARFDEGRLRKWSISPRLLPAPKVFAGLGEVGIPDNAPAGVAQEVVLPAGLRGTSLEVRADISHPRLEQLVIELAPPRRPSLLLAPLGTLAGDSLRTVFTSANMPALQQLLAGDLGGIWRISVRDVVGGDQGKLNAFSVEVQPK